mmetsp:Transcript_7965/g.11832  ORF Transcript_7965/g.11832 Transcript_7965/m.11832 type:complete len:299 (+) Transcript_7965:113-1009(+)
MSIIVTYTGKLIQLGTPIITNHQFLTKYPRGAYTTMRTIGKSNIVRFEQHWDRLRSSMDVWHKQQEEKQRITYNSTIIEHDKLLSCIGKGVDTLTNHLKKDTMQCRITILLPEKEEDCYIHMTALPDPPSLNTTHHIDIMNGDRLAYKGKDSDWVQQRKSYKERKNEQSEEVVLCEDDGSLREGLSSNFFVIQGNTLYTASDHIIEGTIRQLVLAAAKACSLSICLQNPLLSSIDQWDEAFITSTSRLVYPIDQIHIRDAHAMSPIKTINLSSRQLSMKLLQHVIESLQSSSTSFQFT